MIGGVPVKNLYKTIRKMAKLNQKQYAKELEKKRGEDKDGR